MRIANMALVLLSLASGCEWRADAAPECRLTPGEVLTRVGGLGFDDVRLISLSDHTLIASWSDARGVWLRSLNAAGHPLTAATQVTERCAGGLALLAHQDGLLLGCVRPDAEGGGARLYQLDAHGSVLSSMSLGQVGRDGHGIALAARGERVLVAFHEGAVGQHAIHLASLEKDRLVNVARVSHSERASAAPALLWQGDRYYLAWSESALEPGSEAPSQIWLMREGSAPRKLVESAVFDPAPSLTWNGTELVLGFRDRRAHDKRSELYVTRLDTELKAKGSPLRVGRANSEGPPELHTCGKLRAAVLPREYGGEHYVAVHALDAELHNLGGGHQYYANSREFVLTDATCSTDGLTLLVGERAPPDKPGVELLSLRFTCQ
jgi:hypothetical protein